VAAETPQPETCANCRGSGLDPRYSAGGFDCPDCPPAAPAQPAKEADNPRTVCVCGHTRAEHLVVSGRLLCDECDPDSTENLVCKEFEAL
jgi:hypothetical protein